jgi:hypothetical protein
MTPDDEIYDSVLDWISIFQTIGSREIYRVTKEYPDSFVVRIEFKDLLKSGPAGERIAKRVLRNPIVAINDGESILRNKRFIAVTRTYSPRDVKLIVTDIPGNGLTDSEFSKQQRSDSKTAAWKGAVKLRDEFKCRKCDLEASDLQVHHIIPMNVDPSIAWDINNGITLCRFCHSEFHSKYGTTDIGHFQIHCYLKGVDLQ